MLGKEWKEMSKLKRDDSLGGLISGVWVPHRYAGFWRRLAARVLDEFVAVVVAVALVTPFEASGGDGLIVMFVLVYFAYYVVLECSPFQATVGKMALGIIVTDRNGERLSPGRSVLRNIGKVFSAFLGIGFLMAASDDEKRSLHDRIAGTLVVHGKVSGSKTCPRCAESVKRQAKVCRFCGHNFDTEPEVR
jgi:uncharacterized RDD family membrane protein YckC